MAHKRILSFKYAFSGIFTALREEPNMKVHFAVMILAVILGWSFKISLGEWVAVILLIGLVISLELTNTAIETVVDSFTQDAHPGAKRAKDVSAGAVLFASITALLVGLMIFLPHIIALFTA